tara:strand:- start:104675 stop:105049 length:375 start_codon:yes stop_codon:yes gene_type:complete
MNKKDVKVFVGNNKSTLISVIIALALGFAIAIFFGPDPTKDILKEHANQREIWQHEIDSISKRGDSIYGLYIPLRHKADSITNSSIKSHKKRNTAIKKKKDEEINAINTDPSEYIRVLSAEGSN